MAAIVWTDIDDGKGQVRKDKVTESDHIGTDEKGQPVYATKEVDRTRDVTTRDVVQTATVDGVKLLRVIQRLEQDDKVIEATVGLVRLS